ncbi:hypothetical protein [Paraburkholderia xenovorans]|uniref:hypothetical protein n=1 Tax=Paraburkholderia xenovorans TaxID=36873 RepID=UPI0038B9CFE1
MLFKARIGRRRVDAELSVVELRGRLRKGALPVVALDQLRTSCRVSTYVRELVPVVAAKTNEEKSCLVDLALDLIVGEPRIAVSASPHRCLHRRVRRFAGYRGTQRRGGHSELMLFKQLAGKSERSIACLNLMREFLFSFVRIVRLRFSSHSPRMHDSPIVACHSLRHANSRYMHVSFVDLIFHRDGCVCQPMVSNSPSQLVQDATRLGVTVVA